MTEAQDLRDLAKKIEDLSRGHRAHSMAWDIVKNCTEHLCAVAQTIDRTAPSYYAIRHKLTGHFLPPPIGRSGKGGSWTEPTEGPPRLFHKRRNAEIALRAWLKGIHKRTVEEWGSMDALEPQYDEGINIEPQPHRKAEDMEIVTLSLEICP